MIIKYIEYIVFVVLTAALFYGCHNDRKNGAVIPIENFIFKSERTNFKLSPNGEMIAYLSIDQHCRNIFIKNLVDSSQSKQLTYQDNLNVQNLYWVNEETILFFNMQSHGDSLRMFTVNTSNDTIKAVMKPTKARVKLTQPLREFEGAFYASMNIRDSTVFDLYKIYLDGRAPTLIYKNPGNITSWIASHDGKVRLALSNDSAQGAILYRASEGSPFEEVTVNNFETTLLPLGYNGQSITKVIALSNQNRDKLTLVEYDVAQGREIREIYKNNDVDVNADGYVTGLNKLLYASTNIETKRYVFFDRKMSAVNKRVEHAFKGSVVDYIDCDTALNNFIIKVYSDVHAGDIYHYDYVNDSYNLLTITYPQLNEVDLLPMEHVVFNARDNKEIHGFITYPRSKKHDCPLVVLVHDGPSRKDEWGFNPEVQFLANRGYAVFQLNYRGTLGYGKDFWSAGFKEWGGRIQSDITDGVTWLIHEGIVDKNRMAIMGTGFGGYSALHAATFNPSFYRCAISSSGYSNMFTYFREVPPHLKPYVQMYYQIIGNPEKETEFFKAISPVFHADKVKNPVLYFQGGKDRYTSVMDANQFVSKLKQNNVPVRYIFKEEEGRRFREEENMTLYYQEVERFLAKYLK